VAGTLAIHVVSYGLLVPYYWSNSGTSLLTRASIQSDVLFASDPNISVFYVGLDRRHVYRTTLDGTEAQRVCELGEVSQLARLFLRQTADGDTWDLWLADQEIVEPRLLARNVAKGIPDKCITKNPNREMDGWMAFGSAIDLRPEGEQRVHVETGFWPIEGLVVNDDSDRKALQLSLETPFVRWYARCATVLPRGQVIYQLSSQIVLVDIESRKVGLVARGFGPVVIPAANLAEPIWTTETVEPDESPSLRAAGQSLPPGDRDTHARLSLSRSVRRLTHWIYVNGAVRPAVVL
jgi:hypothetical protein